MFIERLQDVYMPKTAKEMIKLLKENGFEIVKGGGKGSHIKMKRGTVMAIVPYDGELANGTEKSLLKKIEQTK